MRLETDQGRRRWSLRAWGLLIGSVACITRGFLYLPPVAAGREPLPLGVDYLTSIVPTELFGWQWQPVWLFGAAWLTVGVLGLIDVITGRRGDQLFLLMIGLMVFWAIGFVGATITSGSFSAFAAGMFYAAVAGWTEVSRRIPAPAPKLTPELIETRLRVDEHGSLWWLHDGRWVALYPEVKQ